MKRFKLKDPGSSITHFIGFILALIFSYPLLEKSAPFGARAIVGMSVFLIGLILLYAASTTYHTFNLSDRMNQIFKKADHMMICVLIAATYTPICLLPMRGNVGNILLLIIWLFALSGIMIKAF
jgi:hemolysin III